MIFGKLWKSMQAQLNKFSNWVWGADPIAQLQLEYDKAVDQLKDGRLGLEQYRALVDRVMRQAKDNEDHVSSLEAKIKAYLQAGDRDTAAKFALELQKAKKDLAENQDQLKMHEEAYNNHLVKVQNSMKKLAELKDKIHKYDAELKMSRAEAEMAKLSQTFNFDITLDINQAEAAIQDKIGLNRAKARVSADLSGQGVEDIRKEQQLEKIQAENALKDFEAQMGLATPETSAVPEAPKEMGPKSTVSQS